MNQGMVIALQVLAGLVWLGLLTAVMIWAMETFRDVGGVVKGLLVVSLGLFMIAAPVYFIVNESAKEDAKPFDGYVYKKTFTAGHYQFMMVGKVMMNEYVPPRWNFILNSPTSDDQRSCDVTESSFDSTQLGQDFHCGGYK